MKFVASERDPVEAALRRGLPVSTLAGAARLNEALEYAVFPGGKRLRPALALLASRLAGASRAQALGVACAVEFLHTSSLILDDLPSMDDADVRRGRGALHLVYGEGLAVLAAVALLNQSYALLSEAGCGDGGALLRAAARCVGSDGMVGGQVVDLETRAASADEEALASRDLKTVALMRLMMTAGALACGAGAGETLTLADFGECFGRAYQVCDDVWDEAGAGGVTGKPARQDARHRRANAVTGFGAEGARLFARRLVARGVARLHEQFGPREEVTLLSDAAHYVLDSTGAACGAQGSALPVQEEAVA
ncbi:MAG TPA: polyprenyl synthetase family protein [Pyrinomonadaceae bacterium]|nr:polyprenyl synthetase family protein [Pyrinomonadaceae bacterium]